MDRQMLEGKVAIITGTSYGMGQTMAGLFAEEGAAVVLFCRRACCRMKNSVTRPFIKGII